MKQICVHIDFPISGENYANNWKSEVFTVIYSARRAYTYT